MITTASLRAGTFSAAPSRAIVVERDIWDVFQYPGSRRVGRKLLYPKGTVVDRVKLEAAIESAAQVESVRAITAYRAAHGIVGPTGSFTPDGETMTDPESAAIGAAAAQMVWDNAMSAVTDMNPRRPLPSNPVNVDAAAVVENPVQAALPNARPVLAEPVVTSGPAPIVRPGNPPDAQAPTPRVHVTRRSAR